MTPKNHFADFMDKKPLDKKPEEVGVSNADKQIRFERAAAQAEAERILAEMNCPNDLIEWGKNHNIPTFAQVTWQHGFATGFRFGLARYKLTNPEEPEAVKNPPVSMMHSPNPVIEPSAPEPVSSSQSKSLLKNMFDRLVTPSTKYLRIEIPPEANSFVYMGFRKYETDLPNVQKFVAKYGINPEEFFVHHRSWPIWLFYLARRNARISIHVYHDVLTIRMIVSRKSVYMDIVSNIGNWQSLPDIDVALNAALAKLNDIIPVED